MFMKKKKKTHIEFEVLGQERPIILIMFLSLGWKAQPNYS